jgi:hypothetical protein
MSTPKQEAQAAKRSSVWEKLFYETLPYVYLLVGVVCVVYEYSSLYLRISGGLLAIAAITILVMRWSYRRDNWFFRQ